VPTTRASSSRSRTSRAIDYKKLGRWDRFRQWLHMHRHHQLCRVVVGREIVGYKNDFGKEYLVGTTVDPVTLEIRRTEVDATVFGGRKVPVYDWVMRHG
jgi:hypothetical protein